LVTLSVGVMNSEGYKKKKQFGVEMKTHLLLKGAI
jgi:hypothetical protein